MEISDSQTRRRDTTKALINEINFKLISSGDEIIVEAGWRKCETGLPSLTETGKRRMLRI